MAVVVRYLQKAGSDMTNYRLTRREIRVLALLMEGHHKKTAADAMGVSINTVSFHLKNLYTKLGVHSKTEAVVKGLLEGIVLPGRSQPLVPDTAPCSQARANFQSRSTVACDTRSVAAISSVVRPAKNFSSTI